MLGLLLPLHSDIILGRSRGPNAVLELKPSSGPCKASALTLCNHSGLSNAFLFYVFFVGATTSSAQGLRLAQYSGIIPDMLGTGVCGAWGSNLSRLHVPQMP